MAAVASRHAHTCPAMLLQSSTRRSPWGLPNICTSCAVHTSQLACVHVAATPSLRGSKCREAASRKAGRRKGFMFCQAIWACSCIRQLSGLCTGGNWGGWAGGDVLHLSCPVQGRAPSLGVRPCLCYSAFKGSWPWPCAGLATARPEARSCCTARARLLQCRPACAQPPEGVLSMLGGGLHSRERPDLREHAGGLCPCAPVPPGEVQRPIEARVNVVDEVGPRRGRACAQACLSRRPDLPHMALCRLCRPC